MELKWGILSAGKISNDFVNALSILPPAEHKVVSVAARELQSAKSFAEKHQIEKYYEGYDNLLDDKDIDIVYIGATNPQHHEWTIKCLNAGKHVLCEKPLGLNSKQVEDMIEAAKRNNRFLMEALWSRFSPAIIEIQNQIANNAIGDPSLIQTNFSIPQVNAPRLVELTLGGGTILDIGVYSINLACLMFGDVKPISIKAIGSVLSTGVDDLVCIILEFPGKKFAQLTTNNKVTMFENTMTIYGEKGLLKAEKPFHMPTKIITPKGIMEFPIPPSNAEYNFGNSSGLSYQSSHVRKCITEGRIESPLMPLNTSLMVCTIMDEIRKQIGVVFPQDG